jgi:hypothetical protein
MPRLKSADTSNGFIISIIVQPTDIGWQIGGKHLLAAYMKELASQADRQKKLEILKGIGADGKRLTRLSKRTIENRRSVAGYADPYAPPLIPAHENSRTYSFLRYEIRGQSVWFFWKHDPHTGRSWGDILRYHADGANGKVRNTFASQARTNDGAMVRTK